MKITPAHVAYYIQQKYGRPSFAKDLKYHPVCVHDLIPTRDNYYNKGNTLTLLRINRKRKPVTTVLKEFSQSSDTRRSADCKKWLKRIISNRE